MPYPAWFSRLADYNTGSDCLYLPSVYKNLVIDGNTLQGWAFNPAPDFFPDMLLYFILMMISSNSIIVASFLFSVIQVAVPIAGS